MSWTLTTSGACKLKAGLGVNSTLSASEANLATFSDIAEGTLNTRTRYDWVGNYSSVDTNFKPILSDAVSCLVAMDMINYDMTGYTRSDAQTMLDYLNDRVEKIIKVLDDDKYKEKM